MVKMSLKLLALVGLVVFGSAKAPAITGVLCIKAVGKGALKARDAACKATEVQVGTFDTDSQKATFARQCAADSVRVGIACVDRYEGSVWETTDGATIASIRNGEIANVAQLTLATQRGGGGVDDYGSGCPDTADGCMDFYAVSVPGVTPSRHLTWFQAAAACRNAGKRLATNQEWQMAALGTPDPGTDNDTTDCNVNFNFGFEPTLTGSRSQCVSDAGGIFDLVGNMHEWVADWAEPATGCTNWSPTYGTDQSCIGGDGSVSLPGALSRGGASNNSTDAGVFHVTTGNLTAPGNGLLGFRCARGLY